MTNTAADSFYCSREWLLLRNRVRAEWFSRGRSCPYCGERLIKGQKTIVDHIKPRKAYPHLAYVFSNLALYHHACHTRKTIYIEKDQRPMLGADGLPDSWRS